MNWRGLRKQPVQPIREKEGCKIKIRRDKSGRVVGYEDNGSCSKSQVEMFKEKNSVNIEE